MKHHYKESVVKVISIAFLTIFIGATLRKFLMLARPEKLHGTLEGFLELHPDFILIVKEKVNLDQIEKILIENNDYYGKNVGNGKGFSSNFSSGTDNYLTLFLKDETKIKIMFEMYNEYDMEKVQNILIHYHKKNLLSVEDLRRIFKLNSKEFQDLQKFLKVSLDDTLTYTGNF